MLRATTTPQLWGNGDDCGTIRPTARKRDRRAVSVRERHGDERSVARAVEKESRAGRPLGARVREKRRRRRRERRFAGKTLMRKAMETARRSDANRKAGNASKSFLDGIPVAVKENFAMRGEKVSAGSKMLSENVASYTSERYRSIGE